MKTLTFTQTTALALFTDFGADEIKEIIENILYLFLK